MRLFGLKNCTNICDFMMNQAGLVLGPQLLGRIQTYRENMFPVLSQDLIGVLASLGYTLFLFLGGVKMDLSMIFRTGRKAMCIGALTLLVPFLLAMGMQKVLRSIQSLSDEDRLKIIMAAAIQASTPFPVIACLLSDLNIVNSELGRLGLSTAVVCDLLSGFLVYGFSLAKVAYLDLPGAAKDIGMVVGYVIIVVFVARPAMFWMVRQTPEGRPVKDLYIFSIILVVLGVALASNRFDLSVVFGPFILGLAVPDGPPLGSTLVQKLDCMVSGVLLPLFVTITMMKANLSDINFNGDQLAKPNLIITIVIVIAKFAACMGPALYCKMPIKDATTLALIMSCKGVCEMAYYSIYRANQVR
jgi:Kef-type K+ transport system membrane component KefB